MPASSKRTRRTKQRIQDFKHTGHMRKAKRTLDTQNESSEVVRELGNRKKFHVHDLCSLQPKTLNQERFLRHFYEGTPLMAALGCAGTGKSFLSLYCALSLVLDESTPYDKVVIVRSAVQGRDQGFIKGSVDEKMEPYEAPYAGIIQDIMPKYKEGYNHLKSLGYLEFHSTSFLRSTTFHRSIIIFSECQNEDLSALLTVATRGDENSRVIFEGDQNQSDMHRKREKSGLSEFEKIMDNMPPHMVAKIIFEEDDIVRSGLAKEIIKAANRTL